MGLAVHEGNTKYKLSTSRVVSRMEFQIPANSYNFDVVKEFIYLGTAININNDVSQKIKSMWDRAKFQTRRPIIVRPLQLSH